MAVRFADVWAHLAHLADAADLPARAREHLAKAQRLTVPWLATLAFFWGTVQTWVDAMDLAPDMEHAVLLITGKTLISAKDGTRGDRIAQTVASGRSR